MSESPTTEEITEALLDPQTQWVRWGIHDMPKYANIAMVLPKPATLQGERCISIAQEALLNFIGKNAGYGEPDEEDLGPKGQFADMHRKWKLIKKFLWDGQPWGHHEPYGQVMKEFIGHLLLTMDFLEQAEAKDE